MDDLQLVIDLHRDGARQGPGGDAETRRALELAGLDRSRPLRIADVGCGTGASARVLARELEARIFAVDLFPQFLEVLRSRARDAGVDQRITPVAASMDALPFAEQELDVVWSEGAVYNLGFEAGVSLWRRFLKPGGILVVSEITWLGSSRPAEVQAYWEKAYPEIGTAAEKLEVLERNGYGPRAYFALPERCWLEAYYRPLESRFEEFLERHRHHPRAQALVEAEREEIALYEQYGSFYSYGVYIVTRLD